MLEAIMCQINEENLHQVVNLNLGEHLSQGLQHLEPMRYKRKTVSSKMKNNRLHSHENKTNIQNANYLFFCRFLNSCNQHVSQCAVLMTSDLVATVMAS